MYFFSWSTSWSCQNLQYWSQYHGHLIPQIQAKILQLHTMFKLRSLPDVLPALYLQQPYNSSSDARIISNHLRIPESKTQEWHSLNMLRGWYDLISLPGRYWYVVSIGSSHTSLVSSLIWGPVSVYIAGLLPGTHPTWNILIEVILTFLPLPKQVLWW
jgi:hypothetical protein